MSSRKGMDEFLKKEDPNLEQLRKKLFADSKQTIKQEVPVTPTEQPFENLNKVNQSREQIEELIAKQKWVREKLPFRKRIEDKLKERLTVEVGRHTVWIWKTRRFEEIYMHVPRFIFLSFSCYVIYRISLKQQMSKRWKEGVRSHRQEEITKQLDEISQVIGAYQPNTFEPLKKVELDKNYTGDQFEYLYQKEEKDLQDQLFKAYDELEDENEYEDDDS